jgi:hypothetical protein
MKDEALRLADLLAEYLGADHPAVRAISAELRRLHADAEESEALRERLSALLTSTAIALRGPAPELVSWSWHDLPERAAALVAQRDALLEFARYVEAIDPGNPAPLFEKARAAIKAVEGEK